MNEVIARKFFEEIESSCLNELRPQLYASAIRYAHYRAQWRLASTENRREMDATRTRAHDAFIDDCNIFSRQQGLQYEPARWREAIGMNRKDIGDFACYITLFLSIEAR